MLMLEEEAGHVSKGAVAFLCKGTSPTLLIASPG